MERGNQSGIEKLEVEKREDRKMETVRIHER